LAAGLQGYIISRKESPQSDMQGNTIGGKHNRYISMVTAHWTASQWNAPLFLLGEHVIETMKVLEFMML
jgi:hypothetical protein